MEAVDMEIDGPPQQSADPFSFARSYQLEALEKAVNENTIVFLETGAGKTLIAIMLLRTYAYQIRKPATNLAIFLVPQVVLVRQQAEAVINHTDLNVGMYWGDMGIDYWDAAKWKEEQAKHEVLVMTPAILLSGLRHCFFKLELIKLLIFDECHHAIGKDPYACIMKEFYHRQLQSNRSQLPRILGLTASLVNCKGSNSSIGYWQKIDKLETILHSKVFACGGESVLAQYIPFSKTRLMLYEHKDIPYNIFEHLANKLKTLEEQHKLSLTELELSDHSEESARKKLSKLHSTFLFCMNDLGLWMTLKAAESLCANDYDNFLWGNLDRFGESIIKKFSQHVAQLVSPYIPLALKWSIDDNLQGHIHDGLLTSKVSSLVSCLLDYRGSENLRCIIFVERVVTSIVLNKFLSEVLPKDIGWKCENIAGNGSRLQSQSRKLQNKIVEAFREGMVNIIVATSILEEGLDVQSCNVVIRFDPCPNVCSFIQSRGRARKENSDFVIMVRSGDLNTISCVQNYLTCGDVMREESLRHAFIACKPLQIDSDSDMMYCVESTGAIVSLNSSISLIFHYCSRLPSDSYFKPTPRFKINKELGTCTLYLPKSCPLDPISVKGDASIVKKLACLEACKKLHEMGELSDNLVPKIVLEDVMQQSGAESYDIQQPLYFPHELISGNPNSLSKNFYCYLIELKPNYTCDIEVQNIMLAVTSELDSDILGMDFNLQVDRGNVAVRMMYTGVLQLSLEMVLQCRKFQSSLFRILLDHNMNKVGEMISAKSKSDFDVDYLLLPTISKMDQKNVRIDWITVASAFISCKRGLNDHTRCFPPVNRGRAVQSKSEVVCSCMLQCAIVRTPHNDRLYHVSGFLDGLNGNSLMLREEGKEIKYNEYFESRHGIVLQCKQEYLLEGRSIISVSNYLQNGRQVKIKESNRVSVELPPELCEIIMSPISISTLYTFSFAPSIMHRLESLLIANNLKKLHLQHNLQNIDIPTCKVLEAITTKKCQEAFHLESLETLGDSFLKYATCQHLYKTHRSQHEGFLSIKKDNIISNASLCRLGCQRKLPGFIRNEFFDPQNWMVPGDQSSCMKLEEDEISSTKVFISRMRKVKSKTVADVVEALIGAYLSTAGELGAMLFLNWLGIPFDFVNTPCERKLLQFQPERLVNVQWLESLLNYSFRDRSLLVEALTHGSYMLPEIPTCYQRLEFLGDAVLDYVITVYLFNKYPGMQPGLLTDLRSASVNNDCYAQSAIRASLHKHLLHASQILHKHITIATNLTDISSLTSTFGWESEAPYPKVLGDIIESLAGAILVDSGYNKEAVLNSIKPLLEPLVTPETVRYHPVRELNQLCQKMHFDRHKPKISCQDGKASVTVEVEANGVTYKRTAVSADKETAKKVASKEVLKDIKADFPGASIGRSK